MSCPRWARLKLRLIHRAPIKAFLAEKRGQGHSKNSVRLMKAPLSALLSEAVDDGIIPVNPALQLGRRLGNRADKLTQSERVQRIRPMTWEQRQVFLDEAAAERRHFALFATLIYASLRPGEGFALRPGDLDFRQHLIRVERAWSLRQEKDTKTHGQRAVDMSRDRIEVLRDHLTWSEGRGPPGRLGAARVALSERGGPTAGRDQGGSGLPPGAQASWPPRLPGLRPPPYVREPAPRPQRADHIGGGPTRPRQPGHDAPVLRPAGFRRGASGGSRCSIAGTTSRPRQRRSWPIWNQTALSDWATIRE